MCVRIQQVIQNRENLVQSVSVELQLLLEAFVVNFRHDLQRPHMVELCLVQLIDDILFLDFIFLQRFQELLIHRATPRISFQIFNVTLKLSHQLTVHHLSPFISERLSGGIDFTPLMERVGGLGQKLQAFQWNII